MTLDDITPSRNCMASLAWLWATLAVLLVGRDTLQSLLWIGLALLARGVVDIRDITDLEGHAR